MLAENLLLLRKQNRLTQEQVAEAVGVSRQALSKWENGESAPDIDNCIALANFYNVTLDDLVRYNSEKELLPIPPRGKHCFGVVTVGGERRVSAAGKGFEALLHLPRGCAPGAGGGGQRHCHAQAE